MRLGGQKGAWAKNSSHAVRIPLASQTAITGHAGTLRAFPANTTRVLTDIGSAREKHGTSQGPETVQPSPETVQSLRVNPNFWVWFLS